MVVLSIAAPIASNVRSSICAKGVLREKTRIASIVPAARIIVLIM